MGKEAEHIDSLVVEFCTPSAEVRASQGTSQAPEGASSAERKMDAYKKRLGQDVGTLMGTGKSKDGSILSDQVKRRQLMFDGASHLDYLVADSAKDNDPTLAKEAGNLAVRMKRTELLRNTLERNGEEDELNVTDVQGLHKLAKSMVQAENAAKHSGFMGDEKGNLAQVAKALAEMISVHALDQKGTEELANILSEISRKAQEIELITENSDDSNKIKSKVEIMFAEGFAELQTALKRAQARFPRARGDQRAAA